MPAAEPSTLAPNRDVRHDIAQRWAEMKATTPRLGARDAAKQLKVSEAQLALTRDFDEVHARTCTGAIEEGHGFNAALNYG